MIKVSVILTTFNSEKFLSKQLQSIVDQSFAVTNIIISDDGSTDNTIQIIKEFQLKHLNIKLKVNELNIGYIKNFESSLKSAKGEIIFFADHDDIWHIDKVKTILSYFNSQNNIDVIFSDGYLIDDNGRHINGTLFSRFNYLPEYDNFDQLLNKDYLTGATMAVRKSSLEYLIPFHSEIVHDKWISILASIQNKLLIIPEKLIYYRLHNNQKIGIKKPSLFNRLSFVRNRNFSTVVRQIDSYILRIKKREINLRKMEKLIQKKSFFEFRSKIKNLKFINRLFLVRNEMLKGNYHRFSSGYYSAISDIFV